MARAFIGMGSNIEPEENMREAVRLLAASVRILNLSTVLETEPVGRPNQPAYYNCVAAIETLMPPLHLKHDVLRSIESRLGRIRSEDNYAPRTIDLDLLIYGDMVLQESGLELPDPEILTRPFLAHGLLELAPDLVLPGSGTAIAEIVRGFKQPAMKPLHSYTALLKGEFNHGQ